MKSIFKKLLRKFGITQFFNYTQVVNVNGKSVKLPKILNVRATVTEPWMTSLLAHVLAAQSGKFLDVGVNLGQTLVKVKSLEPEREYLGFEPNPICVCYVTELIRLNKFHGCDILPVGLFTEDKLAKLALYSSDEADAGASMIADFREAAVVKFVRIPVYSYETLNQDEIFSDVGVVKIDVEGAELEVLLALRPLLDQSRPILLIEVLPAYSSENLERMTRQRTVEELLAKSSYTIYRVFKEQGQLSGLMIVEEFGVHDKIEWSDYICIPAEKNASQDPWTSPLLSVTVPATTSAAE